MPQATAEQAIGFHVLNKGNGSETFALTAAVEGDGASVVRIAADEDHNGQYDPAIDHELPSSQLSLAAGKDAQLFVIVTGAQDQASISLTATAATGTGTPGTSFDGQGDGGGDAVVGQTGASASAETVLSGSMQSATLVKSQSVAAPDGSARAIAGAVITYKLVAKLGQPSAGVEITDPIPAGTTYVAGSLSLDGSSLTDATDADAGRFDANAITVALGDVAAGTRTITFQVKIL